MNIELRKFTKFVDKTFIEGGKEAKEPVLLVSVAAVFKRSNLRKPHFMIQTNTMNKNYRNIFSFIKFIIILIFIKIF